MDWPLIGEVNQGILAFHDANFGVVFVQRGQPGIVLPQFGMVRADVREELTGVAAM